MSGGAEIGALTLILLLDDAPLSLLPFAASTGAVRVLLVVLAAAWLNGLAPHRLALVGIGAAALTAAVVSLLVVRAQLRLAQALVWLAGSTYAQNYDDVRLLVLWPLVVIPVLWLAGRHLDLLSRGAWCFLEPEVTRMKHLPRRTRIGGMVGPEAGVGRRSRAARLHQRARGRAAAPSPVRQTYRASALRRLEGLTSFSVSAGKVVPGDGHFAPVPSGYTCSQLQYP